MNIRIDNRRNKKVKVHSRQSIFKKDHLWLIGNLHMNETTVKQFIMKVSYCVYWKKLITIQLSLTNKTQREVKLKKNTDTSKKQLSQQADKTYRKKTF